MSTQKIVSGNSFNEGGAVTYSNNTGNYSSLTNNEFIRSSLPRDYNMYGVVEHVAISAGAETQELRAAVAGRQIEVLSYVFVCDSLSTVTFKSGSTAISGVMSISANGGASAEGEMEALMITAKGEALNITNSAGNIAGHLAYRIV
jgi:hypothetical protein